MSRKNSNDINDYPDSDLLYPSKYITCGDVLAAGRPVPLTIAKIEPRHELAKTKQKPAEKKPVLYFWETDKGFVMNKTNNKRITAAIGRDPRTWLGKKIVLFVDHEVESFGKIVDGLRVDQAATMKLNRAVPVQQQKPDAFNAPPPDDIDEQALADAARAAEQQDEPGANG